MYPYSHPYQGQGMYRQTYASETAQASLLASPLAPDLKGAVQFYQMPYGVEVFVQVEGLPAFQASKNGAQIGPHGFHIHEKGVCEIGDGKEPLHLREATGIRTMSLMETTQVIFQFCFPMKAERE